MGDLFLDAITFREKGHQNIAVWKELFQRKVSPSSKIIISTIPILTEILSTENFGFIQFCFKNITIEPNWRVGLRGAKKFPKNKSEVNTLFYTLLQVLNKAPKKYAMLKVLRCAKISTLRLWAELFDFSQWTDFQLFCIWFIIRDKHRLFDYCVKHRKRTCIFRFLKESEKHYTSSINVYLKNTCVWSASYESQRYCSSDDELESQQEKYSNKIIASIMLDFIFPPVLSNVIADFLSY